MRKKLILLDVLLIAITLICVSSVFWYRTEAYFSKALLQEGTIQLHYLSANLRNHQTEDDFDLQKFINTYATKDLHIELLDQGSVVIANSTDDTNNGLVYRYKNDVKKIFQSDDGTSSSYVNFGENQVSLTERIIVENFNGYLRLTIVNNSFSAFIPEMTQIILLMFVIGIIISVTTAYFFTRRVMQPIDELTRAAMIMSRGQYDQKIYIDSNDQIGDLASAFNAMTVTLRDNISKLKQSNSDIESVINSIHDGIVAIDLSYRIYRHNGRFKTLLGVKEEILGRKVYDVYRSPQMFELIDKAVATMTYQEEEVILKDLNKVVKLYTNPIYDVNNVHEQPEIVGILLVIRDVTKVRRLEMVRRDFVSNVTHELKTPLTSIRGFVEALKGGAIKDEKTSARFLDIIEIEAERLSDLINDILSLSEIENLAQDKHYEVFQLDVLLDEVKNLVQQKAVEKGLSLEMDCDSKIQCDCNRNRIKQILINLIDNSIKYTEEGSVKIQCRVRDMELYITIKDTGVGIENKHLDRIFERFYRVDKGRSRKMGGTGLGLSIVKHIIELYNGNISVISQVGQGSEFQVTLPILALKK